MHFRRDFVTCAESGVQSAQKSRPPCGDRLSCFYGVSDGTRTRDTQDHNLVLYQLNYTHHSYRTEPSRVLFQQR